MVITHFKCKIVSYIRHHRYGISQKYDKLEQIIKNMKKILLKYIDEFNADS